MSIGVHRDLLLGNQDLMADSALAALSQAGGLAGSGNSGNRHRSMALGSLANVLGISFKLGSAALGAGVLCAGSMGAVGIHVLTVVPNVLAGSLLNLLLGVVAAGALHGVQAVFLAGSGLVVLVVLIQNQVMAQSSADLGGLAFRAANGAQFNDLGFLGAGGINGLDIIRVVFIKGVLTGSGNHFGLQGHTAALALVVDYAILTAGSFHTGNFNSLVLGSVHNLITQVRMAQLAFHSVDAVLLAADSILQLLSNYRNMSIGVHGDLLLSNQDLTADSALHASGQTSGGAGGGNSGNLFLSVTGSRLGSIAGEGLYIGVVTDGALEALAACALAGSSLIASGLILVTSCGNLDIFQDFPAALALDDFQAILGAGSCLGFLLVSNLIVTQSSTGNLLGLTGSAADRALLAFLGVLGAGRIDKLAINKGVLAGSGQHLFLIGQVDSADRALVSNLARVLTSRLYALSNSLGVICGNGLITKILAADGALVPANAIGTGFAVGGSQLIDQHNVVSVLISLGLVILEGVIATAAGALVQGVAAFLTGSGDHSLLHIVAQSRDGSVALDDLGLGIVAAGASVYLTGTLGAGGIYKLAGGLQVMTQGRNLLLIQVLLTFVAVQNLFASHCTGCFFYRLPMGILMLTIRRDIHFGSEGGSGQHGDHHHQRQKSSKDFPLHEITSIEI